MFRKVPMAFLSGLKITELTEERCTVTVPYKRLNTNPFRSTYWAVLGMAAEMSTGALFIMYTYEQKPSMATLIVSCRAEFVKKATDVTTFVCHDGVRIKDALLRAIETNEPQLIECKVLGRDKAGEDVANFVFTWSVKVRPE
ncbi:MAG: DUF4442 domain-containing protein [Candidatus Aminicenantes bacterium]